MNDRPSIFAHKGWNRLVIVLAVAYIILIACIVFYERSTINVFDKFDHRPEGHVSWGWSASTYLDTGAYRLVPRAAFITEVMFLPPIAFAAIVYSILWIHRGFRISRQPSA